MRHSQARGNKFDCRPGRISSWRASSMPPIMRSERQGLRGFPKIMGTCLWGIQNHNTIKGKLRLHWGSLFGKLPLGVLKCAVGSLWLCLANLAPNERANHGKAKTMCFRKNVSPPCIGGHQNNDAIVARGRSGRHFQTCPSRCHQYHARNAGAHAVGAVFQSCRCASLFCSQLYHPRDCYSRLHGFRNINHDGNYGPAVKEAEALQGKCCAELWSAQADPLHPLVRLILERLHGPMVPLK